DISTALRIAWVPNTFGSTSLHQTGSETSKQKSGLARNRLTFKENPLPYGCGSTGYNICGFVGSNPAGDDRAALPWACLCARLDGTVCTLAADDFKTYCLPGPGADCDQDEAWAREYLQA